MIHAEAHCCTLYFMYLSRYAFRLRCQHLHSCLKSKLPVPEGIYLIVLFYSTLFNRISIQSYYMTHAIGSYTERPLQTCADIGN